MASETDSKLNIRVNARALGDLDRQLRKTLGAGPARELNTTVAQLTRSLLGTVRQVAQLNGEMGKVRRGTQAYRELAAELAAVERRGAQAAQTLQRLATGGRGGFGGGGGGPGGGGGGRGAGGGLGGFQMAMPGQGAIQGALSAIPGVGLMAAGGFLAAAGSYSSYLRYEQSRMSAMPFLMSPQAAMRFRGGVIKPGTAGRMEGPGQAEALALGKDKIDQELMRRAIQGSAMPMLTGPIDRLRGYTPEESEEYWNQFAAEHGKTTLGKAQKMIVGSVAANLMEMGSPNEREQFYAKAGGGTYVPGTAPVVAQPYDTKGYMAQAVQYGFNPQEGLDMAGQMARAGRGPMSPDDFGSALAMQRMFGVDVGETGAAQRALHRVGAGESVADVADTIALGIVQGMETSEIVEELSKQTQFLERQASRGMKVDTDGLLSMALTIGAMGVSGHRAGDIARSFGENAAQVGFSGPNRAIDMRLMNLMGYDPKGGAESWAKTRLDMQDPGKVAAVLPQLLDQISSGVKGPELQALMRQQTLGAFGTQIGPGEARALGGMPSGVSFSREDLRQATGMGGGLEGLRASALAGTSGTLRAEAGIESERIDTGGRIAPAMQNLARTTNNVAESFTNLLGGPLVDLTAATEQLTKAMRAASGAMSAGTALAPEG